ncbi:Fur family transcriptional regulator [Parasphaerochaeta coccoides]|uniref:Ferric uptake regulator, Fur family n=1 Tax=Parasphaerochaeta coccoides (strain ATCC BAA-1237 / DSM 17374 / SPN1) TaxID=760011 RepID=F4GIP2_PARC1|nr:transcriptional repressor [Parasphaerochaeta coccoides]AEC02176.1 ferric uptake regulator, Fur family [Parasphaerochaeta coccoides DSM 17374]
METEKNRRKTIQRQLVYDTVCRRCDHPTAEEIYEEIVAERPHLSKATVYRNLNFLVESGRVLRVHVPHAPDRFDHTLMDHHHIHCSACGAVSDVALDISESIHASLLNGDASGYKIHGYDLIFNGLCPDCQKKKRG